MLAKTIMKICLDMGMTGMVLFLMAYEMIGQATHEWLGIGIFALFVIHHILNRKWCGSIQKGRYTPFRIWQTVLVLGVFLTMLGSTISGIIISRNALSFLPITGGQSFGRSLHMISAYWGFVLMSLHLGLHWSIILGMEKKVIKKPNQTGTWILRGVGFFIAVYGIYAFAKRDMETYMLMQSHFVFFDYEEPLIYFLADYIAAMGLLVWIGHYLTKCIKQMQK